MILKSLTQGYRTIHKPVTCRTIYTAGAVPFTGALRSSLPMFYCFLLFLKQVFHYAVSDVLLFVGEELRFSNNES